MADFREMTGCFECVSHPWTGRCSHRYRKCRASWPFACYAAFAGYPFGAIRQCQANNHNGIDEDVPRLTDERNFSAGQVGLKPITQGCDP